MRALVAGELVKVRTTRTALGFALASAFLVLAVVLLSVLTTDLVEPSDKRDALNVGGVLSVPLLLFGIVGATGEYRHRTHAPAVLIAPHRLGLAVARLVAYAVTALGVCVAMLVVAFALGIPLLAAEPGPGVRGADYAELAAGGMLAVVLVTALGVGVGMLVKNQVAAVVGSLLWVFVLSPLLALVELDELNILAAAGTLGGTESDVVSWAGALLVLVGWAVVFVTAGLLVERRRDVD